MNMNAKKACVALLVSISTFTVQESIAATNPNTLPTEDTIKQLVQQCAPEVHPDTMLKIIKLESGFHPFVIGVNESPRTVHRFNNPRDAARKARELIAEGKSIDMGLGQINSLNLPLLKMTPEQVFEPCENIRAAALILTEAYTRTSAKTRDQGAALDQALSIYNTGKPDRGIRNGYVSKVRAQRYQVPALDAGAAEAPPAALQAEPEGPPPSWDVFANARYRGPRERASAAEGPQETASAPQAAVMLFGEPE